MEIQQKNNQISSKGLAIVQSKNKALNKKIYKQLNDLNIVKENDVFVYVKKNKNVAEVSVTKDAISMLSKNFKNEEKVSVNTSFSPEYIISATKQAILKFKRILSTKKKS